MRAILAKIASVFIGKSTGEAAQPTNSFIKKAVSALLLILLAWEIIGRLIIVPFFFPDISLPDSVLDALIPILLGL